jgi:hypothetical protein
MQYPTRIFLRWIQLTHRSHACSPEPHSHTAHDTASSQCSAGGHARGMDMGHRRGGYDRRGRISVSDPSISSDPRPRRLTQNPLFDLGPA